MAQSTLTPVLRSAAEGDAPGLLTVQAQCVLLWEIHSQTPARTRKSDHDPRQRAKMCNTVVSSIGSLFLRKCKRKTSREEKRGKMRPFTRKAVALRLVQ